MAEDRPIPDMMNYELLAQEALRGVVKAALKRATAADGLPGQHHLYITFKTRANGVQAPNELVERYPDEMTIVLQHQYWDLAPGETFFAITLRFGGQPKRLTVPYAAITRFYDPSVQFLLQWPSPETAAAEVIAAPVAQASTPRPEPTAESEAAEAAEEAESGPKIVSLDQFRKK